MGMTVLELLESVAYEIGIEPPSAYNTNLQLLNLLYATCRDLRRSRSFPQQKKTYSLTLTAARTKYYLPEDFYSGLLATQYNRTDTWQLIGPLTDSRWNYQLYGPGNSENRDTYRIFGFDSNRNGVGGQIQIDPAPASTDIISFDYLTSSIFIPKNWAPSTAYTSGTYVNANGEIYICDTNGTSSTTAPSGTDDDQVDGTTRWDHVSAPYEKVLADTDLCLFDDDVIIDGVKYRYYRAKKMDYTEEKFNYMQGIDISRARWLGSHVARADCLSGGVLLPTVLDQGWDI